MRCLSPRFMKELKEGYLYRLLERVRNDRTLCLEIRENSINIYYRGGSLLQIKDRSEGYEPRFDPNYVDHVAGSVPLDSLPGMIRDPAEVAAWLAAVPLLKQAMDLFFGQHVRDEREVQQLIVRDNNMSSVARSTDFYVCDIEYANEQGRFDLVAVHWPSVGHVRKEGSGRRLVLGEVKCGDRALTGTAGLHAHIEDADAFLSSAENVARLKSEMVASFKQMRELKLVDCDKDLVSFSDQPPLLLLILANHDPGATKLRDLVATLPPCPHAELRFAVSSFMGYGLFDQGVLTYEELQARHKECL